MPRPERAVDPAEGAVQQFAIELRKLRQETGGMTYRQLAERSGYSVSTLADAAGGRRLPTLDVALAYAMSCGGNKEEWEAKWRAAAVVMTEQGPASGSNGASRAPYRGLSSFRTEDADLFFGRERLVAEVVGRVSAHPVTVVLGASGVGKSSLLAAGVLPALRAREQEDGRHVRPVLITPGEHPWTNLLRRLASPAVAETAVEAAARAAAARAAVDELPSDTRLLVVVDQFEELFTLCDAAERAEFIDGVLALADRTDRRCAVVLGVRADFYGRCAEHPGLADALRDNQVLVGPMGPEELREAVGRPAAAVGLSVERALLATVVNEAKGQAGALPLLSHALLETWRRRRGDVLTLAGFQAAGGVSGALAQTAEAAYGGLEPGQQRLAAELLLRLLAVDDEAREAGVTRRRVDLAELLDTDPDAGVVISQLADARLITVDEDAVEVAHEALLTAWPRLRGWIEDDRDALREHRKITEATRIWTESGRDPSTLASGARLEMMRAQAESASGTLRLSRVEREFVGASTAQARLAEAAARRRTNRLRALAAVAAALALIAGILAGVAGVARTGAIQARDMALSRQVALTAGELRKTDPTLAAQLSIAGYRIEQTSEARSALIESSAVPAPTRYLGGAGPTALTASEDGSLVAVSNAVDGSVQLLTKAGDQLTRAGVIVPGNPDTNVYALALTPDNAVLAIGDTDAAITLWDVSRPRAPKRFGVAEHGPTEPIERLDIDPSGSELVAAGGYGVFRWDISDPAAPRELAPLRSGTTTNTVTYSSDGDRLAFGNDAGEVQLWDVTGEPERAAVLRAGDRPVPAVSFAPDGKTLAAGSHDRRIRLWDISSPTPRASDKVISDLFDLRVTTTAFSPDGRYFIAGSSDSTIRVFDTSTWTLVQTLPHPDVVTWATFTDDGESILSVATDGTVRSWDLSATLPRRTSSPIFNTPFTADGRRLAVFSAADAAVWDTSDPADPKQLLDGLAAPGGDAMPSGAGDISGDGRLIAQGTVGGEVYLFDVSGPGDPQRIARLGGSSKEVNTVAFSPDGSMLAAGGLDEAIRLWDLTEPQRPRPTAVLDDPRDIVLDLDWHPSGRYLAAGNADSHVYLYDLADADAPRARGRLGGLTSYAYSARFSPDGDMLAVGGVDSVVILWDMSNPARPRRIGEPITGPAGRIYALSFHPRNHLLAATVIDGTTWLWDTTDPERPTHTAVFTSTGSPLIAAAFRPNGDMLAAGGADKTIRTWQTDENAIIAAICKSAGDPITEQEWNTYLHDIPHDPPCRNDGTPA
ncbi:MAG: helix-turn-helix domain-containing protein [Streptosporangiales bacterium]|nr:helix-turn-helix domain-containing protein [Streptosporangiales bacterium]